MAAQITVTLPDGSTTTATLAGRDPATDLAALRLSAPGLATAEAASADDLKVGQLALAIGRPGQDVTASLGIVSAVGGEWRTWHGGKIDRLVRLDLAIYDGFSGGPLIDARGRVLGINTSGLSRAAALTIPVSTVDRVTDLLLEKGRVAHGYMGLGMQPVRLPESLTKQLSLSKDVGLMIVSVEPGGPADKAECFSETCSSRSTTHRWATPQRCSPRSAPSASDSRYAPSSFGRARRRRSRSRLASGSAGGSDDHEYDHATCGRVQRPPAG
jgi:S1-C subfamily serine protease